MRLQIHIKIIFISLLGLIMIDAAQAQEEKYVNIFIFDVTGSMEGRGDGDGLNIFEDVKDIAGRIVRGYSNDTYLVIMPFGRGVQEDNLFEIHIRSSSDKEDAVQFIRNLSANEPETWLSYSLRYGIDKLHLLKDELPDFDERTQQLLLLTDGRGNGPGDLDESDNFNIDGILEQYRVAKTDFPALYSRFFTVGDILTPDEREQFIQERISVTEIGREEIVETSISTVQVKPNRISVYDTSPTFSMEFQSNDEVENIPVSISISSPEIEEIGSSFDISPNTFEISDDQPFEVSILNKNTLDRWMQENEINRVEGVINLEADRLYFQPESQIAFTYQIEPVNVSVEYESQQINNTGRFTMLLNNSSDTPFEADLEISSVDGQFDGLEYSLEPNNIRVEGSERVRIHVDVEDRDKLSSLRDQIEAPSDGEMLVTIVPVTPNSNIDQSELVVGLSITPDRTGFYLLLAIIALLVLSIIGVIVLYFYKAQQAFGEYQIALQSGSPIRLNQFSGPLTTSLTVGKDIFGEEFNEQICTIAAGFSVITDGSLNLQWADHLTEEKIKPPEITEEKRARELSFKFDSKNIHLTRIQN